MINFDLIKNKICPFCEKIFEGTRCFNHENINIYFVHNEKVNIDSSEYCSGWYYLENKLNIVIRNGQQIVYKLNSINSVEHFLQKVNFIKTYQ